ncbi:MAG: hypothetical protein IPL53_16065 [Ignavibacteria bacterium]|nr:hypothetical protein [Ignavibacteria bacterium]
MEFPIKPLAWDLRPIPILQISLLLSQVRRRSYFAKTTDGGSSWSNISGNLWIHLLMMFCFIIPVCTNTYLIAMDVGVFMTNNNGATWAELAAGLPNTVKHLDYNEAAKQTSHGYTLKEVFTKLTLLRDFKFLKRSLLKDLS